MSFTMKSADELRAETEKLHGPNPSSPSDKILEKVQGLFEKKAAAKNHGKGGALESGDSVVVEMREFTSRRGTPPEVAKAIEVLKANNFSASYSGASNLGGHDMNICWPKLTVTMN